MTRAELEARLRTFQDARDTLSTFKGQTRDEAAKLEANNLRNWLEGMIVAERRNATDEPGWAERGLAWLHEKMGDARAAAPLYKPTDELPDAVRSAVVAFILNQSSNGPSTTARAEVAKRAAAQGKPVPIPQPPAALGATWASSVTTAGTTPPAPGSTFGDKLVAGLKWAALIAGALVVVKATGLAKKVAG